MKTFNLNITLFLFLYSSLAAEAQPSGQITCKVTGEDKKPLPFAAVALLTKDSLLVKSAVTDNNGNATVNPVDYGQYLIAVNMVGYSNYISSLINISGENPVVNIPSIELQPSAVSLGEVRVAYKAPFIEAQIDKTVVNVANSPVSAGSSVLDVLQKSPGIVVDNYDNISMRGKQGVYVMIDDKRVLLSGSDLVNMLRGMPAESVDKIELITNPSAKYDAEGNAGIINIKTKKDKRLGTNGSLNASYGQGKYPKSNDGFTINNRTKKFNLFGNYNFGYRKAFSELSLDRKFYANNAFEGSYKQENDFVSPYFTNLAKAGADWYISDKTIAGVVVSGTTINHNTTGNDASQVFDNENIYNSFFSTGNFSTNSLNNYSVNGNFKTTFDTLGKSLSADIDYARYDNKTTQAFTTLYYDATGNLTQQPYILYGTLNGNLDIKSFKADYTNPLKGGAKMIEGGVKSSIVDADNNLAFYDRSNPVEVFDSSKSNHFLYTEKINAAYLDYSAQTGDWSYQLGLRAEMTDATGKQLVNDSSFSSDYIQLFPSLFIQKSLSEKNQLSFTATRRIDRPNYSQLNPFKFFLDPSTYAVGNPYLQPQITWSFELSETFNHNIITTFNYSRTTNNITEVLEPDITQDKITVQTLANLAVFEYYGLVITLPLHVTSWWDSQNNINPYVGRYIGELANTNLSNGNLVFSFNSSNNITLGDNLSAEVAFNYHSREIYAYMTVNPYNSLSVGLQKNVFNRKLNIKMNVSDVFYTLRDAGNTHFNTYDENFSVKRDTRVATLALTYRFGNNASATQRRKTGGADEEKNRANGGGSS